VTDNRWYDCPTIIPYYGGKFMLSNRLVPMLSPHKRYIEAFAGSLSMFFRKKKVKPEEFNILNDIDNNIVNLYRCVVDNYDLLVENIYWITRSRTTFDEVKKGIIENSDFTIPDCAQASKYFFLIRNSFNNIPYCPFSREATWKPNELIKNLRYSRDYIGGSTIENLDFRDLVCRYKPKSGDMWYFDPPYIVATEKKDYYLADFGYTEHEDLKACADMINMGGGNFMISYDDKEVLRDMYSEYNIKTIETKYVGRTVGAGKIFTELVITNYDINEQHSLF